jgi:hypothetical protein
MKWPVKGPVRVAFGAPLALKGDDYAALAKQVEQAVAELGAPQPDQAVSRLASR